MRFRLVHFLKQILRLYSRSMKRRIMSIRNNLSRREILNCYSNIIDGIIPFTLVKPLCRCRVRTRSDFACRVVDAWNSLDANVYDFNPLLNLV